MKFEGISSEAGAFVILGHGFTYIISNLITVFRACGSLWHAEKLDETESNNRCGSWQKFSEL